MVDIDNKLRLARNLGTLNASPVRQNDRVGQTDLEDLRRFQLSQRRSLNLSLSGIARGANVDVEVYAPKRRLDQVLGSIGGKDFRRLSATEQNNNLQLIAASRQSGNRNEALTIASLNPGVYFVRVLRQTGNTPYLLSLANAPVDTSAPTARLIATPPERGSSTYNFTVVYRDNVAVDVSSFDNRDILVTGPDGFRQSARRIAVSSNSNGASRSVTYRLAAPGPVWSSADNGTYNVFLQNDQVRDVSNNFAVSGLLGSFQVAMVSSFPQPIKADGTGPDDTDPMVNPNFTLNLSAKAELQSDGSILFRNGIQKFDYQITYEISDTNYGFGASLSFSSADIKASRIRNSDYQELDQLLGFDFRQDSLNPIDPGNADLGNKFRENGGVKYEITFTQPITVTSQLYHWEDINDMVDSFSVPFDESTNEYIFTNELKEEEERRISFANNPIKFILFVPYPTNDQVDKSTFLDSLNGMLTNVATQESGFGGDAYALGAVVAPNLFTQGKTLGTYGLSLTQEDKFILSSKGYESPSSSYPVKFSFDDTP